jgi:hypothetical protein
MYSPMTEMFDPILQKERMLIAEPRLNVSSTDKVLPSLVNP